jgi:hypothetical protein
VVVVMRNHTIADVHDQRSSGGASLLAAIADLEAARADENTGEAA